MDPQPDLDIDYTDPQVIRQVFGSIDLFEKELNALQIDALQLEINSAKLEIDDLRGTLKVLTDEKKILDSQYHDNEKSVEPYKEELLRLKIEKKKINEVVLKTQQERRSLEAVGNRQQLNLEKFDFKIDKLDDRICELKEELNVTEEMKKAHLKEGVKSQLEGSLHLESFEAKIELQRLKGELQNRKRQLTSLQIDMQDLINRRRILRVEDRNARDHVIKLLDFEREFLKKETLNLEKERQFKQLRLEKVEKQKMLISTHLNIYRKEYLDIPVQKETDCLKRRIFNIGKEIEEIARKKSLKETAATLYADLEGTRTKSSLETEEVELKIHRTRERMETDREFIGELDSELILKEKEYRVIKGAWTRMKAREMARGEEKRNDNKREELKDKIAVEEESMAQLQKEREDVKLRLNSNGEEYRRNADQLQALELKRVALLQKEADALNALVDLERSMALNSARVKEIEVERGFLQAQLLDMKDKGRMLESERGKRREAFKQSRFI